MVIIFINLWKYKADKFIIIFLEKGNRENEFSFGDAEFQVPEGFSFIYLANV